MTQIQIKDKQFGDGQRLLHQESILNNAPIRPVPVEYDDIDNAVITFFDSAIDMTDDNGNKIPIFKLLSNQRFSEYTQTWEHTDKDGNLYMNFKTLNREINPNWGTIHSGMANIPGDNRFTVTMREIVDKTGVECYEITSMSQPLSVDLKYTIAFVTSKVEKINEFNVKCIDLFKAKQCYLYPNNHAMPMVLEQIGDESNYEIDGRKFYSQTISVNVMAYIIPKDDIKVEIKPKRVTIKDNLSTFKKTYIDMSFEDNETDDFTLEVLLKSGTNKVYFTLEDKVEMKLTERVNANNVRVKINGDDYSAFESIVIEQNDDVFIKVTQPQKTKLSKLIFKGKIFRDT